MRIYGPGASVAEDLEPEYIATAKNKAYVTLQEANALAIINIDDASVEKIVGLGLKDHSLPENSLTNRSGSGCPASEIAASRRPATQPSVRS